LTSFHRRVIEKLVRRLESLQLAAIQALFVFHGLIFESLHRAGGPDGFGPSTRWNLRVRISASSWSSHSYMAKKSRFEFDHNAAPAQRAREVRRFVALLLRRYSDL
jgi:hypothetical protein